MIFVFGSNLAGVHGAGAARVALNMYGARWGIGIGVHGSSYAIPTKDKNLKVLPLCEIKKYVDDFKKYCSDNLDEKFHVTALGTGYARYSHQDIATLFIDSPTNCIFDQRWKFVLGNQYRYFKYED